MTNFSLALAEVGVATATTTIISNATNAEPLITALIGFGTALITVVGGELIKFLVAFFKKKTQDLEKEKEEKK